MAKKKYSQELIDKIAEEYLNSWEPVASICKRYGTISASTFYNNYHGPRRGERNKGRKYTLDLKNIQEDSHGKYYWLGFIAADGSVNEKSLNIELKDIDENHLIKFNEFMGSNRPIKNRINNMGCHCSKLSIGSLDLVDYLAQYNIVPNKSLIFNIPIDKIPEQYRFDFVRGMIDGDGNIQIQSDKQISLTFCSGNEKCVSQMRDMLGITNKISFSSGAYHFQVKGNHAAKIVLDKLYATSTEQTRLERKYNIYKQTLN